MDVFKRNGLAGGGGVLCEHTCNWVGWLLNPFGVLLDGGGRAVGPDSRPSHCFGSTGKASDSRDRLLDGSFLDHQAGLVGKQSLQHVVVDSFNVIVLN